MEQELTESQLNAQRIKIARQTRDREHDISQTMLNVRNFFANNHVPEGTRLAILSAAIESVVAGHV